MNLVQFVQQSYSGAPDDLDAIINRFVDELATERLVLKDGATAVTAQPIMVLAEAETPFKTPVLEKYSDMQTMLLTDPIHDVDERGWPNAVNGA